MAHLRGGTLRGSSGPITRLAPARRGYGYAGATRQARREPSFTLVADTVAVKSAVFAAAIVSVGSAQLTLGGGYGLLAYGTSTDPNQFSGTLSFSLKAYGGGSAPDLAMGSPYLLATGVGVAIGRALLTLPTFTLNASGTVSGVGKADLTLHSRYTVRANAGGGGELELQGSFAITASGTGGGVAQATVTMPLFSLEASGSPAPFSVAMLSMPAFVAVPSGAARLVMPGFTLVASGSATIVATFEAYAINLIPPTNPYPGEKQINQVTHYTDFPFTQIVRFEDNYYGVGADGIYKLGGDTDNGVPIAWAFDTARTDFGSTHLKRMLSAYVGGRLTANVNLKVSVGESAPSAITYPYVAVRDDEAQTNRVLTGAGLRSRYYSVGLDDPLGNFIEIDALDFEIETLARNI